MARKFRIKISEDDKTNRNYSRICLAALNSPEMAEIPADGDHLLMALMGIGYAVLDVADAFRERNYLLADFAKRDANG